jgi:hypothetical protein
VSPLMNSTDSLSAVLAFARKIIPPVFVSRLRQYDLSAPFLIVLRAGHCCFRMSSPDVLPRRVS